MFPPVYHALVMYFRALHNYLEPKQRVFVVFFLKLDSKVLFFHWFARQSKPNRELLHGLNLVPSVGFHWRSPSTSMCRYQQWPVSTSNLCARLHSELIISMMLWCWTLRLHMSVLYQGFSTLLNNAEEREKIWPITSTEWMHSQRHHWIHFELTCACYM